MVEIGYRYQELYWAGADSNWEYAGYQLAKIDLALANARERRPKRQASAARFLAFPAEALRRALRRDPQLRSYVEAAFAEQLTAKLLERTAGRDVRG